MAKHLLKDNGGINTGENGNAIPAEMIRAFKERTAATLRQDKFTYQQSINKELANIERVRVRQGQFVGFLASIMLSFFMFVSNLASIWVAARLGFEDVSYEDGSQ